MGFSRQEYWNRCHFLSWGIFLNQELNLCLMSPALAGVFFTTSTTWEAHTMINLAISPSRTKQVDCSKFCPLGGYSITTILQGCHGECQECGSCPPSDGIFMWYRIIVKSAPGNLFLFPWIRETNHKAIVQAGLEKSLKQVWGSCFFKKHTGALRACSGQSGTFLFHLTKLWQCTANFLAWWVI